MYKRILLVIGMVFCLLGTSLSLEMDESFIIETAIEDAVFAFENNQFTILDNWQINGWLRVTAPIQYKYFENLHADFQKLYMYSFYLELNKTYFSSLNGKEVDKLFFNQEVLKTVEMLPVHKTDISDFVKAVLERDPILRELREYTPSDQRKEMQEALDRYQLSLMPDDWDDEFSERYGSYLANEELNSMFAIGLIGVAITIGLLILGIML